MDLQALSDEQLQGRLLFHWRGHLASCQAAQAPRGLMMFDELLIEATCRADPHRLLMPVMRHVITNGTRMHDVVVVERIIRCGVSLRTPDQPHNEPVLYFVLYRRMETPGFPGKREQALIRLFVARGCSLTEVAPGRLSLIERANTLRNAHAAMFLALLLDETTWSRPPEFTWDLALDGAGP